MAPGPSSADRPPSALALRLQSLSPRIQLSARCPLNPQEQPARNETEATRRTAAWRALVKRHCVDRAMPTLLPGELACSTASAGPGQADTVPINRTRREEPHVVHRHGQRAPRGPARAAAGRRVVTDPLRRLAYGTDASFYRLVPRVVVVAESDDDVRAVLRGLRTLGATADFSRRRDQPVRPGHLRLRAGAARRGIPDRIDVRDGGAAIRLGPAVIGGACQPRARAARPQDRPRPGLDRHREDRRHRGQQRQRHVLRHAREQLSHAGRAARGAGRRRGAGHRRRGERRRVPGIARRSAGERGRPGAARRATMPRSRHASGTSTG